MQIPSLSPFWPDRRFISSGSYLKAVQIMRVVETGVAEAKC